MDNWKSCDNCKSLVDPLWCACVRCKDDEGHIDFSMWEPIRCRCGGPLSEQRIYNYDGGAIKELAKYDGKRYRHCYACHAEFFEEAEHG